MLERSGCPSAVGLPLHLPLLLLAGPGRRLLWYWAAITALSASLPVWKVPLSSGYHMLGLTLAPITLHGPLADSVLNFWLPLLAFGPEPCRPHFPSHLLLCVSLPCVACRATGVGSK